MLDPPTIQRCVKTNYCLSLIRLSESSKLHLLALLSPYNKVSEYIRVHFSVDGTRTVCV